MLRQKSWVWCQFGLHTKWELAQATELDIASKNNIQILKQLDS